MKKFLLIFLLASALFGQTKWSDYPRVTSLDTNDVFLMSRNLSMKSFLWSAARNYNDLRYGRLANANTWTGLNTFNGGIAGNGSGLSLGSNISITTINDILTVHSSRIAQDSANLVLNVRSILGGIPYNQQDSSWTGIGYLWDLIASGFYNGLNTRITLAESGIKINSDSVAIFSNKIQLNRDSIAVHRAAINVNSSNISLGVTETNKLKDSTTVHRSAINLNSNNITLKVSSTDYNGQTIASKINLTDQTVTIDAKHIKIDGTTTFSAGYDPTGKIALGGAASDINNNTTTISGGKIRSGLIESNNWGLAKGSQYDLTKGIIKLGGSSAPSFSVDSTGYLTSVSGKIANINIATNKLYLGTGVFKSSGTPLFIGQSGISLTDNFSVDSTGLLTAKSGSIGLGATSYSLGNGVWISSTALSRFRVGNASASRMQWDDTNLEIYNSSNQKLVSFGAVNTFAGWTVNPSTFASPSSNIVLDNTNSKITLGTGTNLVLDGANKLIGTSDYTAGLKGWQVTGLGDAFFNNIDVRGSLKTSVFVKGLISATAGSLLIGKSAGKIYSDYIVSGTLSIEGITGGGWLFDTGDIIRIKAEYSAGVGDTWISVTRGLDYTTYQTYTTTYLSGTNTITYPKGTGVVDYGVSGQGLISLSADGTIGTSANLTMFTHAGAPYTTITPQLKLGNLNGSYGYITDTYGFATGQYGAGAVNITIEPTNGFRVRNNTTTLANWDNSGNILIGQTGVGQNNVYITSGAIHLRNNVTDMITLNSDGTGNFAGNITSTATITGGVIQTSASGQRVVIDTNNRINFYNTSGVGVGYISGDPSYIGTSGNFGMAGGNIYTTTQTFWSTLNFVDNNSVSIWNIAPYNGLGLQIGATNLKATGNFLCNSFDINTFFIINSSGQITKINNTVTSKYVPISNGIHYEPRLLAMTDLPAQTASKALVSDASGYITAGSATSTEIGYLSGVTSAIQTQLNSKQATITGAATTITSSNLTASKIAVSDASGKVAVSTVASSELFTPAYGELYDAVATSTITCDGTTYVKWTGSTVGNFKGVTGNVTTDDLTIDSGNDGKYLVQWSISFKANTTGDYYWTVNLTGGADGKNRKVINIGTANVSYTISGQSITTLNATNTVNLGCLGVNGNIVTVTYANLSITKLSN